MQNAASAAVVLPFSVYKTAIPNLSLLDIFVHGCSLIRLCNGRDHFRRWVCFLRLLLLLFQGLDFDQTDYTRTNVHTCVQIGNTQFTSNQKTHGRTAAASRHAVLGFEAASIQQGNVYQENREA